MCWPYRHYNCYILFSSLAKKIIEFIPPLLVDREQRKGDVDDFLYI